MMTMYMTINGVYVNYEKYLSARDGRSGNWRPVEILIAKPLQLKFDEEMCLMVEDYSFSHDADGRCLLDIRGC